jgi:1,2-diacylglycerol 3-alpha-glucosyltransferase
MKIVMLCELYNSNLQYQDNLLAKYYFQGGHDVHVVASTATDIVSYIRGESSRRKPTVESDQYATIHRLSYLYNFRNRLWRLNGVSELLENLKPDFVFVHDVHPNLRQASVYKACNPKTRLVMDCHADESNSANSWISKKILHGYFRKRLLNRSIDQIDEIYPVVPASADFLQNLYSVEPSKMTLFPLGADTDTAEAYRDENVRKNLRLEIGIPEGSLTIFTGGKLEPHKKTDLLYSVVRNIPGVHLIVAGAITSSSKEYRERLLSLSQYEPRIHELGWVDATEVYKYMAACDVAVFPASQSVLWQQSLSMGLPLIVGATQVQDPSYLNRHGCVTAVSTGPSCESEISKMIGFFDQNRDALTAQRVGALETFYEILDYRKIVKRSFGENYVEQ